MKERQNPFLLNFLEHGTLEFIFQVSTMQRWHGAASWRMTYHAFLLKTDATKTFRRSEIDGS